MTKNEHKIIVAYNHLFFFVLLILITVAQSIARKLHTSLRIVKLRERNKKRLGTSGNDVKRIRLIDAISSRVRDKVQSANKVYNTNKGR